MKKLFYFVASIILCFTVLSGCNTEFKPEAEYYYKTGDVYRVLELESNTPEHKENYGLESAISPASSSAFATATLVVTSAYAQNSILFDTRNVINREGAEVVYNYLGIEPEFLQDSYFICSYTGLYSYNKKVEYGSSMHVSISLDEYTEDNLLGNIADVDIYTFNYKDLSVKDGSEIKSGSFRAIVVVGNQYVGRFSLNNQ